MEANTTQDETPRKRLLLETDRAVSSHVVMSYLHYTHRTEEPEKPTEQSDTDHFLKSRQQTSKSSTQRVDGSAMSRVGVVSRSSLNIFTSHTNTVEIIIT